MKLANESKTTDVHMLRNRRKFLLQATAITASPLLATVRAILQKTYLEEESKPRQDSSLDQPTEKHSQTGEVHSSHLPQGPHQPQGQSEKDPQDNSRQNARHPEVPS